MKYTENSRLIGTFRTSIQRNDSLQPILMTGDFSVIASVALLAILAVMIVQHRRLGGQSDGVEIVQTTALPTDLDAPFRGVGVDDNEPDTLVSHERGSLVRADLVVEQIDVLAMVVREPDARL